MAYGERLAASPFASRCHVHLDEGCADQQFDLNACLSRPAADRYLYVCGPQGFISAVRQAAAAAGWAEANVHFEYFGAAPASSEAGTAPGNGAFVVRLASSGQEIPVAAEQSVTAALAAAGVEIPLSCEQGVCGTCLTGICEGIPDHRDQFLTAAEKATNRQFLPCCSRSHSHVLTLDL